LSERIPGGGPFRAASGMHEALSVEHVREARRLLSYYCRSRDFCEPYVERMERIARSVAALRLADLGEEYKGVDEPIIKAHSMLVAFYAAYLAGFLVVVGDYVLVEALGDVRGGNVKLVAGDVAPLPLDVAAGLYVAGLARPVESNAIRLHLGQARRGGEG